MAWLKLTMFVTLCKLKNIYVVSAIQPAKNVPIEEEEKLIGCATIKPQINKSYSWEAETACTEISCVL